MESFVKKSVLFLVVIFALFGVLATLTQAQTILVKISLQFFILATIFYLVSLLLWMISWAYLIKKHSNVSFFSLIVIGLSSIYGSLTPIQLGADALRSIKLKDFHKISYEKAVPAALIVKGIKFSFIAIITSIVFFLFLFDTKMDSVLFIAFLTGFTTVLLGAFLFLAPLKKRWGLAISEFFYGFKNESELFVKIGDFFQQYSIYLEKTDLKTFFVIIVFIILSWIFEFLALQFSFFAVGIQLYLSSFLVLMILFSVLERVPIFPRGIGLVELFGYYYLSTSPLGIVLSASQIGAVIIVYDIVRLVIPTVLSFITSAFLFNHYKNKTRK